MVVPIALMHQKRAIATAAMVLIKSTLPLFICLRASAIDGMPTGDGMPGMSLLSRPLRREPDTFGAVIRVTGSLLQSFLGGIDHQIPVSILLREFQGAKRDRYIFRTDTQ